MRRRHWQRESSAGRGLFFRDVTGQARPRCLTSLAIVNGSAAHRHTHYTSSETFALR